MQSKIYHLYRNAPMVLLLTSMLAACGAQTQTDALYPATSGTQSATSGNVTVALDRTIAAQTLKDDNVNTLTFDNDSLSMFNDEFVVRVKNQKALQKFLEKYNAVVLNNGNIPTPPQGMASRVVKPSEWKLVKLISPTATLEELADKLNKSGAKGTVKAQNQKTVNQMNFLLGQATSNDLTIEANYSLKVESYASQNSNEQLINPDSFHPYNAWWLNNLYGGSGDATGAWNASMDGTGVTIAVIDAGFKKDNPELTGINPATGQKVNTRSIAGYNFDTTNNAVDPYGSWGAVANGDASGGETYHGQAVADIALGANNNGFGTSGVAPNANGLMFRLGRSAEGYLSYYDAGYAVDTATAWGANIINMSFTALTPAGAGVPNTYLGDAINRADAAGVILVASLGNQNRNVTRARYPWSLYPVPASWTPVIAVAAVNKDGSRSSYSSYGERTDIFAPGGEGPDQPQTSVIGSDSCWQNIPTACYKIGNLTRPFSGTSASSPYIAGVIALMKQAKPSLNRQQIVNILRATSWKNINDTKVNGIGVVQAGQAVRMAQQ